MATNIFARFRRLLPDSPTIIATVSSVGADGTSMVLTSGGGAMRVFGDDVAVGAKAFVRDGAIIGPAPDLPYYELQA